MKPPFPAFEIRRTDRGVVIVTPCTVLEIFPETRTARVLTHAGGWDIKTTIAFGDIVSTKEKASARVLALLDPPERTPFHREDSQPSSAAEPPLTVAGRASPEAAENPAR